MKYTYDECELCGNMVKPRESPYCHDCKKEQGEL
jgi:hypothetical protein